MTRDLVICIFIRIESILSDREFLYSRVPDLSTHSFVKICDTLYWMHTTSVTQSTPQWPNFLEQVDKCTRVARFYTKWPHNVTNGSLKVKLQPVCPFQLYTYLRRSGRSTRSAYGILKQCCHCCHINGLGIERLKARCVICVESRVPYGHQHKTKGYMSNVTSDFSTDYQIRSNIWLPVFQ